MVKGIEAFPVDFHGQSTITTVRKIKIVRRGFGGRSEIRAEFLRWPTNHR